MTTAMITRSILEILAVIAMITGLLNEEKLIRWEDKKLRKLRKQVRIRKALRHKQIIVTGEQYADSGKGQESVQWMHRPNRKTRTYKGHRLYTFENHAA